MKLDRYQMAAIIGEAMGMDPLQEVFHGTPASHIYWKAADTIDAALSAPEDTPKGEDLPADVVRLVIAARMVAWEDPDPEHLKELQDASELFASRVPWEDEPEEAA